MEEMNLKHYAYLGDAVWELFVREITVTKAQKAKELHKLTTTFVNAGFQHELANEIQEELSDEESDILRRARNIPVPIARKSNQADYRMATAFETLIGWWHVNDKDRLEYFLNKFSKIL